VVAERDILHYRILDELGQGAMGQVFRAVDQKLGRQVALKLLPAEVAGDAGWEARMLREARAAGQLNHPGIVTLHDIEHDGGRTFLVMELVHGERLSDLATQGVPWRRAVELAAGIADALGAAHALGILHRDIKTENVMVTKSGQPKVLDFGLAKLKDQPPLPPAVAVLPVRPTPLQPGALATLPATGSNNDSGVTQAGQLVGTPSYMAPECFEGLADVRSEVFSLGVVLYELLTGKRPFEGESTLAVMAAIQMDEPKPPSVIAPERGIPPEVDAIVMRAIAKGPNDRFADMAELRAALLATIAASPVAARPALTKWWFVVAALGGGVAIAAGLYLFGKKAAPKVNIAVHGSRRLTLDAGCEEYPKFHPDGKRIVYDADFGNDYEIVVRDLETGAVTQLTHDKGWDYAAALSPDGKRVAYIHEDPATRTLRVLELDGTAPAVDLGASVGYPAWSADGGLLLGDVAGRILKRDLATGKDTVMGQLPAGARLYHLVEIAGRGLAVEWWTSSDNDATSLGELDPDGTLRVVAETATEYEGGLAAARGMTGYFSARKGATEGNELIYRPWGGGALVQIPGGLAAAAGIDVSRDGTKLVLSTCKEKSRVVRLGPDDQVTPIGSGAWQDTTPRVAMGYLWVTSDRLGPMAGWMIDLAGVEQPRRVTPERALGVAPSPDGTQLVFAANGGRGGLSIAELGGVPRRLTSDPSDASPAFDRTGANVLFERTVEGVTTIFAVPAEGGEPRRIAAGAQPAASPTDNRIVYVTAPDAAGARRVMITAIGDALSTPVAGLDPAGWQRPVFSPDGTKLALMRGYQEIVIVTLDGSAPPATVWSSSNTSATMLAWAPDGTVIASIAEYDGDLWLADGVFP
jgi:Tol biopolymer transport system component